MTAIVWQYDDGGRFEAGFKGSAGDCAVRAVAIATGRPYQEVYDDLNDYARRTERRKGKGSSARNGVFGLTVRRYLERVVGWVWVPTMFVGSGCQVHLRNDELPDGPLIVNLSKHYAAVIDGILLDTHDCSRDGTRCVYGYFRPPTDREQWEREES